MTASARSTIAVVGVLTMVLGASACTVVREEQDSDTTRVAVATPVGSLAARTGEKAGDTGLPVYPGSQPSRNETGDDPERANVAIGTPWFGLRVVAAEYESRDSAEQVLAYYRPILQTFGAVTECQGDVDFKNGRPVCGGVGASREIQLVVGTEEHHRMVSVHPRGDGSTFALVSIQMGGK